MSEFDIPESWAETSIGEVVEHVQYGANASATSKGDLKLLRITDISENGVNWELVPFCNLSKTEGQKYKLNNGDIVFARTGATVGKSFRIVNVPNNAIFASYLIRLLPKEPLRDERYFQLFFNSPSYWESIKDGARGAAQPNVNAEILKSIKLPLPPLGEQKRIVAKIESTQEKIKSIEQCVSKAEELIGKYRESLLQKAFRGEFVPQDPNDEPASKLLERIRADRAKESDGKKKKKDDLPPIKPEEIPFEIPKSWEWVRLGEIGDLARGKSKHRPRNEPKLFGGKYPFIQTGDVAAAKGGVIEKFDQTLSEFGLKQSRLFPMGTLCITIAANIADTAVLGFEAAFPDSVVGFTPLVDSEIFDNFVKFIQFYIQATKDEIDKKAHGAAQKNINLEFLENLLVPLPSRNNLIKTVQVISHGMKQANQLSNKFNKLLLIQNMISSAILKSAFSGSLVPQDPSEGTGHELLRQISLHTTTSNAVSNPKNVPKKKQIQKGRRKQND